MEYSIWNKVEACVELRALANAIDSTQEPDRIALHLQDIQKICRVILRKKLHANQDWLTH